jgi:hypothetical protein
MPSWKLRRQPSEQDQVEALSCKFGTESSGYSQGCDCERRHAPHQYMPLDLPSDTAPDSQGLAREPHGSQMRFPTPTLGEYSLWIDIDESIVCTW